MTQFVSPENNDQFFEQFYEKNLAQVQDLSKHYLVCNQSGVALESKGSIALGRAYSSFWGTSYDVQHSAKKIVAKAKDTLLKISSATTPIPEEKIAKTCVAASRTCLAIEQIVKNATAKKAASEELKRLEKELQDVGHAFLQQAAQSLKVTRLRIACQSNMMVVALFLIDQGEKVEEAVGSYTQLLPLAYSKEKFELCRKLIGLGADPKEAFKEKSKEYATHLLFDAVKTRQSDVAIKLLDAGASVSVTDPNNGEEPLHIAAKEGLQPVIDVLLTKGANINALDRHRNTPLHTACRTLQVDIALHLVKKGADVSLLNKDGFSAFCLPSNLPEQDQKEKICDFYAKLFQSYRLTREQIENFDFLRNSPNPLEVALLFQDEKLAKSYAADLSQQEFFAILTDLKKKYPKSTLDLIELCHLEVANDHYQQEVPNLALREPSRPVAVDELYNLFATLNFSDSRDPNYFDRQKVLINGRAASQKELKELLTKFVARLNGKADLMGGKPSWDLIELCVKNCLIFLLDKEKTVENLRNKVDLLLALIQLQVGEHCAGEYVTIAQRQYRKICKGYVPPTFEAEIYTLLAEHRERLLDQCVDPNNRHNLNDYNYLLNALGKTYAIPGHETCQNFLDPLGHADVAIAERRFKQLYSVISIQKDCLEAAFNNDLDLRTKFENWCYSHKPADWGVSLLAEAKRMKERGAAMGTIRTYLKDNGVEMRDGDDNFEQAIEEVRKKVYRTREVYGDKGKVSSLAVSRLLAALPKPVLRSAKLDHAPSPTTFVDWEQDLVNMITS